ncbi:MAG: phospholipase [Planctomycetota bacterium]|nr:phospholipase [Planctomycetota bacterium]
MKQITQKLGRLNCTIIDSTVDADPELVIVLCHGFGAPGTDLVGLGSELLHIEPKLQGRVLFVFPEAPLSLADQGMPGGRAWWPLDVMRLQAAIMSGNFRDLRADHPDGLSESRDMLFEVLQAIEQTWHVPLAKTVLGGFSQGSMLATDVMLRLPTPAAALCVLSGTLLSEASWRQLAADHTGLRVFQSHGRQDTILPFVAAEWLRDLLREFGFDVEFLSFNGQHGIPPEALNRTAQMLLELLPDP